MSDEFSKTIRAYAGGANPKISISSVPEAAAHIASCRNRLTTRPANCRRGRKLARREGRRRAGGTECIGD
jgi:hypothetical protein